MMRRLMHATVVLMIASFAKAEQGRPFDVVPFGYVFRVDRPADLMDSRLGVVPRDGKPQRRRAADRVSDQS